MESPLDKLKEARFVFIGLKTYKLILDFIIAFLLAAVFVQLLGASLLFALLLAMLCLVVRIVLEFRRVNIIERLESNYGGLRERLSTAYDNRDRKRNIIVDSLMDDVSVRLDDVESSSFMESKALATRTVATVVLTFLLLTVTVLNIRGIALGLIDENTNIRNTINDAKDRYTTELQTILGDKWEASNWSAEDDNKLGGESGGKQPGYGQGPIPGTGFGTGAEAGSSIFGKASSASIDGKDVDFRLHPEYGGSIEIQETTGKVRSNEFQLNGVESADTCDDCAVGPEHEEIVRKYFEKISEGS